MKFKINKDYALAFLTLTNSVTSSNSPSEALSCIEIKAEDNTVKITSTDLESTLTATLLADVSESGSANVKSCMLYELVKKFPEKSEILFKSTNGDSSLQVSTENIRCNIGISKERYPVSSQHISNLPGEVIININEVKKLFLKAGIALSQDNLQKNMSGMFIRFDPDKISCVTTDGYRLSIQISLSPTNLQSSHQMIIPRKSISVVQKILSSGSSEVVKILFSDRMISFVYENIIFSSKLVDAEFPDYESAIPKKTLDSMKTKSKSIIDSVDRANVVLSDRTKSVSFKLKEDSLQINSKGQNSEEFVEELHVSYRGQNRDVLLNSRYLADVLHLINSETEIQFHQDSKAVTILDSNDPNFLYILMPRRH